MDFSIKNVQPETVRTACVVVPVYRNRKLSDAAQAIDKTSGGQLLRILKKSDFDAAPGTTLMLFEVSGVAAARVLLMGAGRNGKLDPQDFRKAVQGTLRKLCDAGVSDADMQMGIIIFNAFYNNPDDDVAMIGEFDGVADQVG